MSTCGWCDLEAQARVREELSFQKGGLLGGQSAPLPLTTTDAPSSGSSERTPVSLTRSAAPSVSSLIVDHVDAGGPATPATLSAGPDVC